MSKADFWHKFGNRLRGVRRSRGVTRLELAKKLGCPLASIAVYENGHSGMSVERLRTTCIYLRVSANYLLYLEKSATRDMGHLQKPKKEIK